MSSAKDFLERLKKAKSAKAETSSSQAAAASAAADEVVVDASSDDEEHDDDIGDEQKGRHLSRIARAAARGVAGIKRGAGLAAGSALFDDDDDGRDALQRSRPRRDLAGVTSVADSNAATAAVQSDFASTSSGGLAKPSPNSSALGGGVVQPSTKKVAPHSTSTRAVASGGYATLLPRAGKGGGESRAKVGPSPGASDGWRRDMQRAVETRFDSGGAAATSSSAAPAVMAVGSGVEGSDDIAELVMRVDGAGQLLVAVRAEGDAQSAADALLLDDAPPLPPPPPPPPPAPLQPQPGEALPSTTEWLAAPVAPAAAAAAVEPPTSERRPAEAPVAVATLPPQPPKGPKKRALAVLMSKHRDEADGGDGASGAAGTAAPDAAKLAALRALEAHQAKETQKTRQLATLSMAYNAASTRRSDIDEAPQLLPDNAEEEQ